MLEYVKKFDKEYCKYVATETKMFNIHSGNVYSSMREVHAYVS